MTQTHETAPQAAPEKQVNVIAILSYIWILFIIPLLIAKDDAFVKYHVKQGIALFIAELILMAVGMVPLLGWVLAPIGGIITLILAIIGIVNVLQGKEVELPIVGQYARNFKI